MSTPIPEVRSTSLASSSAAGDESRQFLAAVMECSSDMIAAFDPGGRVLSWNRGAQETFGYTAAEVLGKPAAMLVPPDRHGRLRDLLARVVSGEAVTGYEGTCQSKDGRILDVSVTANPIFNGAGAVQSVCMIVRDITGHKQMESTRALLASIVESSHEAVMAEDLNGALVSWNRGAELLFGYTAGEILGRKATILLHQGREADVRDAVARIRAGNQVGTIETVLQDRQGRGVDVALSLSPIRQRGQGIAGVSIFAHDISHRKRAEAALKESEERFRVMADCCSAMIWVSDAEGGVRFVNQTYRDFFAIRYEDVEGSGWRVLIHPEDRDAYIGALLHALAAHTSFETQIRLRRPDGEWRRVSTHASPRWSAAGEFQGHVGLVLDITERAQAEEAVRRSEEKFRQLAENVREVFWMMNAAADEILYINPAYEEIWGRSCESLRNAPRSWADSIVPEDREAARATFLRQLAGENAIAEFRIRRPDGSERWIRDHAFPIRDETGRMIRLAGIAEDVTERKRYEQELLEARRAADAANQAKSSFLANMSHEIRTPMNGVVGMLQLLAETELTSEQRMYAEVAQSSSHSLLALIQDVLDLSKIEAQKISLEDNRFELRRTLAESLAGLRVEAREKGLGWECTVAPDVPDAIHGDPLRLRQILVNLTANAVKFTERGSVGIGVWLESATADRISLRFEIADTGIGLSREQSAEVFSPFVQGDASTTRKYGGTGLGLAICKQLVELMGGSIGLDSEPGQGSTFRFTAAFGRHTGSEAAAPATAYPTRETAASAPQPTNLTGTHDMVRPVHDARILVADDNPTNRIVILAQLNKLGYRAQAVTNGAEAVEAVRRGAYDLVLMDCQMPVMDGDEATRQIRDSIHARVPIVALTANAMAGDRARCIRAGMNDYLAKPLQLRHLAEMLERWVNVPAGQAELGPRDGNWKERDPVFDQESLLDRLMNDRDLAEQITGSFLHDGPTQLERLRDCLNEADSQGAALQAHSLGGAAAAVSAGRLQMVAAEMEASARARRLDRVAGLLPRAVEEFASFQSAIEEAVWP